MSAHDKASMYVLKVESSTPGTFTKIIGLTNLTSTFGTGVDEITTKEDNQFSANAPGRSTLTISAEGFCRAEASASIVMLRTLASNRTVKKFQTIGESGDGWIGEFMITAFGESGGVSGAQTFSITLQSMGEFAAIV